MKHPSDEQLYEIAEKIIAGEDMSADVELMNHIAECDACYQMVCCIMAMQGVAQNVAAFAAKPEKETVRQKVSAVIRLAVDAVNATLDQLGENIQAWRFRKASGALLGTRSGRSGTGTRKLTDTGNSRTFVAYDAGTKTLSLQFDEADFAGEPKVVIRQADMEDTVVEFEKFEDLYWAEYSGFTEGEYQIILEK